MPRLSILAGLIITLAPLLALSTSEQQTEFVAEPVHASKGVEWKDCGQPTTVIRVKSIEVSPDPPQPGQNMTIKVKGLAQETIEWGAYADVTVKLGLIKLLQKRFDVCEEARDADASIQCPVEPGEYEVEQTVALPEQVPKAKFLVQVRGFTVEEADMVCVNIEVDFFKALFANMW